MSYKSGEIYFLREAGEQGYSPFVKVGLVADGRVSQDRLVEHQTGNPRKLELPEGHVVRTDLVSRVESQLHSRFSTLRVGGEWFSFESDAQLQSVIDHAQELAKEAATLVPLILEAERLELLASNGETRPADEDLIKLGHDLASAKAKAKLCAVEVDRISQKLKAAEELGETVPSRTRVFQPKFDQTALEADFPDLAKKYLVAKDAWTQRFLTKSKLPADYEPEGTFTSELMEIRKHIDLVESPSDFALLSAPSLWLTKLKALVAWDLDILEVRLKVACGQFEAIEGVCSWKRESTMKTSFDLEAFIIDNSDLYLDYLADGYTKTYPVRNRGSKR
jgi:hypothetical protein